MGCGASAQVEPFDGAMGSRVEASDSLESSVEFSKDGRTAGKRLETPHLRRLELYLEHVRHSPEIFRCEVAQKRRQALKQASERRANLS